MAKRKMVTVGADTSLAVTMVQEPQRLSEMLESQFHTRRRNARVKRTAAEGKLIDAIRSGVTRDGWIAGDMEWFHEAAAIDRAWQQSEPIFHEHGLEGVIAWATDERNRLIDHHSWRPNSSCPWSNAAKQTDVNATIRILGGRHDSIIDVCRHILDGLKDGSIVDDTH